MSSYLHTSDSQLVGVIGTIPDERTRYRIGSDASRFFLNIRDPASANGSVSAVRFCYIFERTQAVRLYQATVGFYRRHGETFTLTYSFNITKNGTLGAGAENNDDSFQCENLSIPKFEVHKGDLVGACSKFFDKSIGRIILEAKGEQNDTLYHNGIDDRLHFCYTEGSVPLVFTRDQIEAVDSQLFLLYANITESKWNVLNHCVHAE